MGLLGMAIGAVTTVVGVIKDDEKMVKRGVKRTAIGTASFLVGDVCGLSDVVAESVIDNDA